MNYSEPFSIPAQCLIHQQMSAKELMNKKRTSQENSNFIINSKMKTVCFGYKMTKLQTCQKFKLTCCICCLPKGHFFPQHNIILQKIRKMFSYLRINSLTRSSLVICSSVASPRVEYLTRLLGDGYPAEERCKQKMIKTLCQRSSPKLSSCSNL